MEQENAFTPLAERPRPTVFAAAGLVLLAALGLWVASLIASGIEVESLTAAELLTDAMYYLPFALLPTALYCLRRRGLSEGLRLNPMPLLPTLTVIFLALMCVYAASAVDSLWVMLLNAIGLSEPESLGVATSSAALSLQVITSAAIPAICEELLFRGVVFSAFERRGTWLGLWASSALFALMHGNLFGFPAYFLVGAVAAFVVYALDSLYAGMLFHTVYNAAILVIVYLMSGQPVSDAAAGPVSVAAVTLDVVMTGLMITAMLLTLNLRRRTMGIEPVPRDREPMAKKEKWMLIATVLVLVANTVVVQVLTEVGL